MADLIRSSSLAKKIAITLLLALLVALTLFARSATIDRVFEPFDNLSKEYLNSTLTKIAITYGSVRVVYAAISLVKNSTINPPFSSIAIGELLTPVSDLLQNLSDLLLISIASLGAQRIFLELSQSYVTAIFVPIGSLLLIAGVWLDRSNLVRWGGRALVVGLLLRLVVPLMSVAAHTISVSLLSSEYQSSYAVLAAEETKSLEFANDEKRGLLDKIKSTIGNIEQEIGEIRSRVVGLSESVISLFIIFVFETIIFPLFSLWIAHLLLIRSIK